jgi:hypothetical protein
MSSGRRTLLVGTTKGAFLISEADDGAAWAVKGPYCHGWPINHVIGDPESGALWAGGGGDWHGAGVWRSDDGGTSWKVARLTKGKMDDWAANDPNFAKMIGWTGEPLPFADAFSQIWSLEYAHGKLYAGTKPASLLVSEDGGRDWARIQALSDHPSSDSWNPGAAGLVLHTIVSDPGNPKKLWVGISAAGVFATEDGGASWERRNRLSNAEACGHHPHPAAPRNGDIGHCVHNMMRAPGTGDVLYQQNHHGVWRTNDGGRSWDDLTNGLPSTFGFPIRVHPRDPNTIWTLPLNGDMAGRLGTATTSLQHWFRDRANRRVASTVSRLPKSKPTSSRLFATALVKPTTSTIGCLSTGTCLGLKCSQINWSSNSPIRRLPAPGAKRAMM